MTKVSRWLGLSVTYMCDRCSAQLERSERVFCADCLTKDPSEIRSSELKWRRRPSGMLACDRCGVVMREGAHADLCYSCASSHIDNRHVLFDRVPPDDLKLTRPLAWARSCLRCGGARVVVRDIDRSLEFRYYLPGESHYTEIPCECIDRVGLFDEQGRCSHSWIKLTSNLTPETDVPEVLSEMLGAGRSVLGIEKDEAIFLAFGYESFWCSSCGLYYELSPGLGRSLPERGRW